MTTKNLLIEIRTEELPPKSLMALKNSLVDSITKDLNRHNLAHSEVSGYATPRRLAVIVNDLAASQPSKKVERRGPALASALDETGQPSKALLGFARSCGITNIDELEKRETEKGTWFYYNENKTGEKVSELIPEIVAQAIKALPIERKMRWGSSRTEFVRPVHSYILMYGEQVIPAMLLDHHADKKTMGHRFMSQGEFEIESADSYVETLRNHFVIVNFEERIGLIRAQISAISESLKSEVVIDEILLEEVAALVEWPVAMAGDFDQRFLDVPEEALVSAMKEHQRYFHLVDSNGKLLPKFITVANIESKNSDAVVKGNERVITPRLSDAAFFFNQDKKSSLESKIPRLEQVVFQKELGSYKAKVERVSQLSGMIARSLDKDVVAASRAGLLCKSDLVSNMVNEFPDLQGLMGGYYAKYNNETNEVCEAIADHYLPSQSGGQLPRTVIGCCVSIADKADTLTGLFGIGQPPTGSKDPYALRRQTLGVIRMCVENKLEIDVKQLLESAAGLHDKQFESDTVYSYVLDRLEVWYQEQGINSYLFNSLRHNKAGIRSINENHHQLMALKKFVSKEDAEGLIAANKRVANILKKVQTNDITGVETSLFEEEVEKDLYTELMLAAKQVETTHSFSEKLEVLGTLKPKIELYFEQVLVNCEKLEVRNNRIATLYALRQLFLGVADFSLLKQ
ncbi:MAG: glycyl-tRNA synthetase beta chain [Candidatus Azotimanducaceae bacterium]|jgi:glycyl-tRNA synthetase beta chain